MKNNKIVFVQFKLDNKEVEAYVDLEKETVYLPSKQHRDTIGLLCSRFGVEFLEYTAQDKEIYLDFDWAKEIPGIEDQNWQPYEAKKSIAIELAKNKAGL